MAMITRHSPDAIRRACAGRDTLCKLLRLFPNMPEDRAKLIMAKIRECNEIIATDPNNEPWQLGEALDETIRTIGDCVPHTKDKRDKSWLLQRLTMTNGR